jgi:hypothetical protein
MQEKLARPNAQFFSDHEKSSIFDHKVADVKKKIWENTMHINSWNNFTV